VVYDGCAIMIPAGKWHNLNHTGNTPLKLYSFMRRRNIRMAQFMRQKKLRRPPKKTAVINVQFHSYKAVFENLHQLMRVFCVP
jgi:hypothetical protein